MRRAKNTVWATGVCLFLAVGIYGQTQRPSAIRSGDNSASVSSPVEPDSPGAGSAFTVGPLAVVPRLMKFSGALHDAAGKPLSGTVDVTFSLYNTEAGGNPLWFETQSVQADELGRYTALIGAMHTDGLPMDLFTSGEVRWLGIQVGLEPEQQPRVLLVSVPYALKAGDAETLGGKPPSAYMLSESDGGKGAGTATATSGATAGKKAGAAQPGRSTSNTPLAACTAVTSGGTAVGGTIAMFTTACNIESSGIYQVSGNIGIGTASPATRLHVANGDIRLVNGGSYPVTFDQSLGSIFTITNGAGKKLAFDYNGSLGLGTVAPAAKLHIQDGSLRLQRGGSYAAILDQSLGSVFTITNGVNKKLTFDANGNLGIGTTTPVAKLDVSGDLSANAAMTVDNGGTNNGSVNPGITFGNASEEGIASKRTAGGNQFGLDFYTGNTNRMAITRTGLVGIGTTSPQYALDVVGNIRALTDMNVDGLGVNNGTLSSGLTFGAGSGEGLASKRTAGGNQYGLDFYTAFADRMSIRQSGQVGIGTTNPYTAFHIREDVGGGLGPTLLLMNGGAGANAGASIDWDGYDPGSSNLPSARIQSYDDGNFSSHLTFQTKVPGAATNSLVEQVRISSHGSLIVDSSAENTGTLSDATSGGTGLIFGGSGSGEGIASCRTGTSCPPAGYSFTAPNIDGLDFFTNYHARMSIANNGDIYLSGCAWWSNGNNQGNCPSDARLKTNIQPIRAVLDRLSQLQPVHFNYRTADYPQLELPKTRMTGLIAQEVESVFPELVSTGKDGFKRLDSGPLKFMLLESVRELKDRNDDLRLRVGKQQAQLRQARIEAQVQRAELQQARNQNQAQEVEIRKLAGQVRKLRQEQTEITLLKARLDRLEEGCYTTLRAEARPAIKSKQTDKTQVARTRF